MRTKLKVLDLFSGIGGFSYGLESTGGFQTITFCEINTFCQKILKTHWPHVYIHDDIKTLNKRTIKHETVDVVCGGFPCQSFSVAGKRRGTEDDRYLWPEMFRIIKEFKPAWVIAENVTGIINMALDDVLSDLEGENYSTGAFVIPACAVNACHRRDRIWIVAHSGYFGRRHSVNRRIKKDCKRKVDQTIRAQSTAPASRSSASPQIIPNTNKKRIQKHYPSTESAKQGQFVRSNSEKTNPNANCSWQLQQKRFEQVVRRRLGDSSNQNYGIGWPTVSPVRRADDGLPPELYTAKRIASLGNSIVPQIAEILGCTILATENLL